MSYKPQNFKQKFIKKYFFSSDIEVTRTTQCVIHIYTHFNNKKSVNLVAVNLNSDVKI